MVSENILIVDDEARMRKLIKDFLAQKDMESWKQQMEKKR